MYVVKIVIVILKSRKKFIRDNDSDNTLSDKIQFLF